MGYDTTLIGYLTATLIFSFSLFKDKLFDTITVAKDLAVDDLDDGLIVLDNESTTGQSIYMVILIAKSSIQTF